MMKRIKKSLSILLMILIVCLAFSGTTFMDDAFAAGSQVIDGKDGWYFYSGESTISDYTGTNLFSPVQLETLRQKLMMTRDALAAQGIEFVVFLAPNKEHVYSEYMPDSYGPVAPYTRIDQVYDYLKDDLRVIYPINELIEAKETWPQYDFYYRTDTHWNDAGWYIASQPLVEELGLSLPYFGDLTVLEMASKGMELAQLSGRNLADKTTFLYGYTDRNIDFNTDYKSYYRYHTEGADPRKVVIYGDSFGMGLSSGLSSLFNDVYAIYRGYEDPDLMTKEQPDIVIYEVLERFLDGLVDYPLIP